MHAHMYTHSCSLHGTHTGMHAQPLHSHKYTHAQKTTCTASLSADPFPSHTCSPPPRPTQGAGTTLVGPSRQMASEASPVPPATCEPRQIQAQAPPVSHTYNCPQMLSVPRKGPVRLWASWDASGSTLGHPRKPGIKAAGSSCAQQCSSKAASVSALGTEPGVGGAGPGGQHREASSTMPGSGALLMSKLARAAHTSGKS